MPPRVYLLCEDDVAQEYLAPYYIAADGSLPGLLPASNYSLTATIEISDGKSGTTLRANIQGGSGQFDLEWKCLIMTPDSIAPAENLGTDNTVMISNEPSFIRLDVVDQFTGQGASSEVGIGSNPSLESG